MSASDLVAQLAAAGTPPELLAAVAHELFAGEIERKALEERRKHERERKARSRSVTGQSVTGAEVTGQSFPLEVSPQTPLPKTPSKSNPLNPPKPRAKKAVSVLAPDWMPIDQWLAFVAMRERMHREGKPRVMWSEDAANGVIAKLERLRAEGHCPAKLLEKAVVSSWRTVFPDDDTKASVPRLSTTNVDWAERAKFFEKIGKHDEAADCRRKATPVGRIASDLVKQASR